jgi:hypothetical protein
VRETLRHYYILLWCTSPSILSLILLTWRNWWANNAGKWQMGFNSAFKGLRMGGAQTLFPLHAFVMRTGTTSNFERTYTLIHSTKFSHLHVCVSFMTPWYSRCDSRYTTLSAHNTDFTIYRSLQHAQEISPVNRAMEAAPLNFSVRVVTHLSSAAHDSGWLIIQEHTSAFNYATDVSVELDEALSYGPVAYLCLALQR